jgi:hypothetical protein
LRLGEVDAVGDGCVAQPIENARAVGEPLYPILTSVPLQFFAYHITVARSAGPIKKTDSHGDGFVGFCRFAHDLQKYSDSGLEP